MKKFESDYMLGSVLSDFHLSIKSSKPTEIGIIFIICILPNGSGKWRHSSKVAELPGVGSDIPTQQCRGPVVIDPQHSLRLYDYGRYVWGSKWIQKSENAYTISELTLDLLKLTEFISFFFPGQSAVAGWKQSWSPETCTHMLSLVITTTRDRLTANGC